MLISFSVANYGSIKEKQTLSFRRYQSGMESRVAIDDELAGNDISPVAVVYGANASGKSTFLHALSFVRNLVEESALRPVGRPIRVPFFALSEQTKTQPFQTEVVFTTSQSEYSYSFKINNYGNVISEKLLRINPEGKRRTIQTIFSRKTVDGEHDEIRTSSYMHGAKKHIVDSTRPNSLFLSKAAQENNKDILDAYEWFVPPEDNQVKVNNAPSLSVALFENDPKFQKWVLQLIKKSDLGIGNIKIILPTTNPPKELVELYEKLNESDDKQQDDTTVNKLIKMNRHPALYHFGEQSMPIPLDWHYESDGTKSLWNLAGNLYTCLKKGLLLSIDELSYLHPALMRQLVYIFQSKRSNPNNAQLLFTTHDISLLGNFGGSGYALDRDQIGFTEKDADGATSLYPLTDFDPRRDANTEKMYIGGRFGAVPLIDDLPTFEN